MTTFETNALELKDLCKSYPGFSLDHLNLTLPSGCILGLIGENGAGKTTAIKLILDIIRKDSGTIRILGKDCSTETSIPKEEIGVVMDEVGFPECLTPTQIGLIMKDSFNNWDSSLYSQYLQTFHLPEKKEFGQFSKGMKMKLEFAAALSHDPKLIILDEATSGLDPVFRDEILDILREYTEDEEHTILISSHITSDLDKISDYIAFLHEGRLLFVKTYDEIQENYGVLNCGQRIFDALDREDIEAYRKEAYGYRVLVKNKQEIRKVFSDLEIEAATIEDVMLYCVKGEKVA